MVENKINLIKCGTKVITKIGKIDAIITAATIRLNSVQYEISYFKDGDYRAAWLNEYEFTSECQEKQKVGFKK